MIWHDNTGAYQTTLSIGMAGHLDTSKPPLEQLESTMILIRYLCGEYNIPKGEVKGHKDHWPTKCPGWDLAHWKEQFYEMLETALVGI